MTIQEIIEYVNRFYKSSPTLKSLWDFTNATIDYLIADDMRTLFKLTNAMGSVREGGKTALVAPTDLGYGLSRMFQIMADTEDFPFNINVFRTLKEANQWLLEKE